MNSKQLDRRRRKTQAAIFSSLQRLLQSKQYEDITVQEIIDQADVGRTTFYDNFATKDDLLNEFLTQIFQSIESAYVSQETHGVLEAIPFKEILAHLKNHADFLTRILNSTKGDILFRLGFEYWGTALASRIKENPPKLAAIVPEELLVDYVVTTTVSLIKWWLNQEMSYTPEEMNIYWQELLKELD